MNVLSMNDDKGIIYVEGLIINDVFFFNATNFIEGFMSMITVFVCIELKLFMKVMKYLNISLLNIQKN